MSRRLPTGALSRTAEVTRGAAEVGLKGLLHAIRRPLLDEDERREGRARLDADTAKILFRTLGRLRGTALKVAQMMCLETDLVPDAVAQELRKACYRVPPLSPALARDSVRQQLGGVETVFSRFNPRAFAAASLGQVHAATLRDGTEVAVKIQYPGVRETIATDLAMLRGFVRTVPNPQFHLRLLDEIAARITEECDYRREAAQTTWFREQLGIPGLAVPAVIDACSRDRVITTTRASGLHLDEWLATGPDPAVVQRAAQRLYDGFARSLYELSRVHADPNHGNVLFGEDGEVTLLDFGCVRELTPQFSGDVAALMRAYADEDEPAIAELTRRFGLFGTASAEEARALEEEHMRPFAQWLAWPMQQPQFDFAKNRGYAAAGRKLFVNIVKKQVHLGIRAEFVFVNRTLYGLYRLFEDMGATVSLRLPAPAALTP